MLLQVYEQMEPPAEMLMSLLPFQKEFLAWAVSQERGEIRGGILADEMGMGKTIQVLSFVMHAMLVLEYCKAFPSAGAATDSISLTCTLCLRGLSPNFLVAPFTTAYG